LRPATKLCVVSALVGLIGLGIGLYTSGLILAGSEWNPSVFLKFPESRPEQMDYATGMLGRIVPAVGEGHDGKYYFIQAMDPFYLEPESHARMLDRPSYRAQRMLYPTLGGGFGLFPPLFTAWALWGINLAALGLGGWLTARLASEIGLSPWLGVLFFLTPGVLISSLIDTGDVLGMLFFVAGALMIMRRRYARAGLLLVLAALSRETMLLAAAGAVAWAWRTEKRVPPILGLPFVVTAGWWVFLRFRIGYLDDSVQDLANVGVPLNGFYEALQVWASSPGAIEHMLFGVLLMVLSLLVVRRAWLTPSVLGYMTASFALVAITMTVEVWSAYFDSTRALIPVIPAFVLMVLAQAREIRMGGAPSRAEPGPLLAKQGVPTPAGPEDVTTNH
jgi:hypothetical protein